MVAEISNDEGVRRSDVSKMLLARDSEGAIAARCRTKVDKNKAYDGQKRWRDESSRHSASFEW